MESASASWNVIWSTLVHPEIKKKCLVIDKLYHLSVYNKYSIQEKDMLKDSEKVKVRENWEVMFLINTLKSQRITL